MRFENKLGKTTSKLEEKTQSSRVSRGRISDRGAGIIGRQERMLLREVEGIKLGENES